MATFSLLSSVLLKNLKSVKTNDPSIMIRSLGSQVTNRALLIRPKHFRSNEETLETCSFQSTDDGNVGGTGNNKSSINISEKAVGEFENLKKLMKSCGVEVNEEQDRHDVELPDSVFPNNWVSFHGESDNGGPTIVLYPMLSKLRRQERQESVVTKWQEKLGANVIDLSQSENEGVFLEGTGSMVLDRVNRLAYACISPRTDASLLEVFCKKLNYQPIVFHATHVTSTDASLAIYHTNVMMSVAEKFAIVCLDSIRNDAERDMVKQTIEKSGKAVIPISEHQMTNFVGNALQLATVNQQESERYFFMSTRAYNALEEWQKTEIEKSSRIAHTAIETIETYGGGGVRCMIAEIFPPI